MYQSNEYRRVGIDMKKTSKATGHLVNATATEFLLDLVLYISFIPSPFSLLSVFLFCDFLFYFIRKKKRVWFVGDNGLRATSELVVASALFSHQRINWNYKESSSITPWKEYRTISKNAKKVNKAHRKPMRVARSPNQSLEIGIPPRYPWRILKKRLRPEGSVRVP